MVSLFEPEAEDHTRPVASLGLYAPGDVVWNEGPDKADRTDATSFEKVTLLAPTPEKAPEKPKPGVAEPRPSFAAAKAVLEAASWRRQRKAQRKDKPGKKAATAAVFAHVRCTVEGNRLRARLHDAEQIIAQQAQQLQEQCVERGKEVSRLSREVVRLRALQNPGEEERDELLLGEDEVKQQLASFSSGPGCLSKVSPWGGLAEARRETDEAREELRQGREDLEAMRASLQAARRQAMEIRAQLSVSEEVRRHERMELEARGKPGAGILQERAASLEAALRAEDSDKRMFEDLRRRARELHERDAEQLASELQSARVEARRARRAARAAILGPVAQVAPGWQSPRSPEPDIRRSAAQRALRLACVELRGPAEAMLGLFGAQPSEFFVRDPAPWVAKVAEDVASLAAVLEARTSPAAA